MEYCWATSGELILHYFLDYKSEAHQNYDRDKETLTAPTILCDNMKVNPAKTIESTILAAHQDHNNNLSVFRWDFGMIEDHGIQESLLEEDSNDDGLTTGAALWRFLHGN